MRNAVETELTQLPESRVRLQVQVAPQELEQRIERKARDLSKTVKLPGFRRGKVPAQLLIRRIGRDTLLEEAVQETLPRWYAEALQQADIVPVGDPEVSLGALPAEGQALQLSIEVGVLPRATLRRYRGLQVPRREPAVDERQIDEEVQALRERLARLETADRPAQADDFVVVDHEPVQGAGRLDPEAASLLTRRDQLLDLGADDLLPGFAEALIGAGAGEARTVEVEFPRNYGAPSLAGRRIALNLTVKEVKSRELPPVDEDLAIDLGFDDLQELRDDVRSKLEELDRRRVEAEFREAALDAAVAEAEVQVPRSLIDARAREMWERILHSLAHSGVSKEAYLKIDGRSEEQIVAQLRPDSERALRRQAVVAAVIEAEGIAPSEQRLEEAVAGTAQERAEEPAQILKELRKTGRIEDLTDDLAAREAVELIAEHAVAISPDLAAAREKLWTPERERDADAGSLQQEGESVQQTGQSGGGLWTPGR